jgi:hypothetical protein
MMVDHPLLDKLRNLDKVAARRFVGEEVDDPGFGALGLLFFREMRTRFYPCTPKNVVSFAGTGGEGVHFSLLVEDDKATEESPVVVTIPESFENHIVGENLFDFLCLGVDRGFFALEQLHALALEKTLEVYSTPDWEPKNDSDWAVGYGVNGHQRKLLDFLATELGLVPWKDLKRKFLRLQERYMPLLEKTLWM